MKHMKKLLALMLALLMVFAMVACGSSSGDKDEDNSAKAVAKDYIRAYETGKATALSDLIHEAVLEAEGMTSDDFQAQEEYLVEARKESPVSVKLSDGKDLDEDELEELTRRYQENYGLEVEDAQVFEATETYEQNGSSETESGSFYVVKIDGQWYIDL